MKLTLRPFVTVGVALTAAGATALSPLAPPAGEIHVSTPRVVSEAVQPMAVIGPITALTNLINDTSANLQGLATLAGMNPQKNPIVPILEQFLVNQLIYAQDIGGGLLQGGTFFVKALSATTIPDLQSAVAQLLAGNPENASADLANALFVPINDFVVAASAGFGAVTTAMGTHLANLGADVMTITETAVDGIVFPVLAALVATGTAAQNVVTALNPFDPVGLVNALLAAPFIFADGALNTAVFGGLLNKVDGPIASVLFIRNLIATAIDPPLPSWLSGLAPAAATPNVIAKTVTVNVTPRTANSAPLALNTTGVKTDTKLLAGNTTTPAANSTAASNTPSANVKTVLDKVVGLGVKPQNGKSAKK